MRHVFEMQPVKHNLEGQTYFLYSPLCLYSFGNNKKIGNATACCLSRTLSRTVSCHVTVLDTCHDILFNLRLAHMYRSFCKKVIICCLG